MDEHSKNKALQTLQKVQTGKDVASILENAYQPVFSREQKELLRKQLQQKHLDRFDITILLKNLLLKDEALIETVEKFIKQKSTGKYVKKTIRQPVQYSLIVIDEAENYLKEQINLIKTCVNPKTNSVIYVGDLVQQTLLWTIRDWNTANEQFQENRQVILHKVYRNTRQILEFILSIGYKVAVPANIKEGKNVVEKIVKNKSEEVQYLSELVEKTKDKSIGILAKTEAYLKDYKSQFSQQENVHVLTINEAQGVEFERVFVIGINKELYNTENLSEEIAQERRRVNRDLLYVAFTRAIDELYVLGTSKIKELLLTTS